MLINAEGENAVEAFAAGLTITMVGLQHHFRIRVAQEMIALLKKFLADLFCVIEFSVVNNGQTAVMHGLCAALGINDAESAMQQGAAGGPCKGTN